MKRLRAGRKQFKTFCRLNSVSKRSFYEIHCFAFRYFAILWKAEMAKASIVFPEFKKIMDPSKEAVNLLMMENIADF